MLTFDQETHAYRHRDVACGSVTQIIGEFVKSGNFYVNVFTGTSIPSGIFESAGQWGTSIHTMVNFYIDNDLDLTSITEEMRETLTQYQKWEQVFKPEVLSHEKMLYSTKYGYAGTYDIKALINGKLWIIDIKTGAFGMAGPQLGAYGQLDKEDDKSRAMRHRAVLRLPKDGDYRFIPMAEHADWPFFLSRLTTYNYVRRQK